MKIIKKIDVRSFTIGFLLCTIAFLTMGFKNDNFDHIVCKSITINNQDNNEIAYLGESTKNSGIFYLNNKIGDQVTYLGSNESNGGMITINNEYGKRIVYLGEDTEANGLFSLVNKYGTTIISAGADVENNAGLADVFNNKGNLVGRLTVVDDQGVFILLDSRGDISFGVPND